MCLKPLVEILKHIWDNEGVKTKMHPHVHMNFGIGLVLVFWFSGDFWNPSKKWFPRLSLLK
jgi:hypothetical protein